MEGYPMIRATWPGSAALLAVCMAVPALASPAIEVAGGAFVPLVQQSDLLDEGYEVTAGMSAAFSPGVQLFFGGSYARVNSVGSVVEESGFIWQEPTTRELGKWNFINLSFDVRFGWGLDTPRQFWYSGGLGWYYVKPDDSPSIGGVPGANNAGFRFGAGGSLPLGRTTRIGLQARYTIIDAAHEHWDYYVGALQLQTFLALDL